MKTVKTAGCLMLAVCLLAALCTACVPRGQENDKVLTVSFVFDGTVPQQAAGPALTVQPEPAPTPLAQTTEANAPTAQTPAAQPAAAQTAAPAENTQAPAAQTPVTQAPTAQAPAAQAPATQAPTAAPAKQGFTYQPLNKKGELYKTAASNKIWAGLVGSCYLVFKDIDSGNEWGETGKVYELYVTYIKVGENYSMWSDGYWSLNDTGTVLTLTPKNQSNNGNIGAEIGQSKTYNGKDGVFEIPLTFEQGGSTTVTLDLTADAQ